MNSLADRIKAWRHALGMTQEEFAARAGIPKRTLVGYENAEREPGSQALAAIARTGVNMTWLLTGEGEMLPPADREAQKNQDIAPAGAASLRYGRRLEKLDGLLAGMPDEEALALLEEFFSRAKTAAELAELRQAVAEIRAAAANKKTA